MAAKRWVTVLPLLIMPVVSVALALVGFETASRLMGGLSRYKPGLPFESISRSSDAEVPPASLADLRTSRRVLLVVVDGLRRDTSEKMAFLNELRAVGKSGSLMVKAPSFSKPGYAMLATGADHEVHGIVLNDSQGPTPAESLFSVAAKAGLRTSAVADDWWKELVGPVVTYEHYYPDASFYNADNDDRTFESAWESLATEKADLTLVHFGWTDVMAHDFGADDEHYLKAAQHIDELIRGLASQLDLSFDTIVVTADHGHLAHNMGGGSGHGGWELEALEVPLVAAGAGIAPGQAATRAAHDLSPTLAALLGLPAPAHSEGRIAFDYLSLSAPVRSRLAVAQAMRIVPFARAYCDKFAPGGGRAFGAAQRAEQAAAALADGHFASAYDSAERATTALHDSMARARSGALQRSRLLRLPVVLAILMIIAACLALYGRYRKHAVSGGSERPGISMLLAGGALYLVLDILIYRGVMGGTYTLGALSGSDPLSLMRLFAWPSYASLVVVALWFWITARRRKRAERVAFVEGAAGSAVLAHMAMILAGLGWSGLSFDLALPDFAPAFWALVHLLKLTFLVVPALALVILAAAAPGVSGKKAGRSSAGLSAR